MQHSFVSLKDVINGMKFGRFGREDGALVMTTIGRTIFQLFRYIVYPDFLD